MRLIGPGEAAEALGITRQALSRLAKESDCPVERTGAGRHTYRWPDLNLWYMARKVAEATRDTRPADFDEARARREAAMAEMAEWELQKMRGELMTTEEFQRVRFDTDARVAAKLKNLPMKLAPLMVGCVDEAEALGRVGPPIRELMDELHRGDDLTEEAD